MPSTSTRITAHVFSAIPRGGTALSGLRSSAHLLFTTTLRENDYCYPTSQVTKSRLGEVRALIQDHTQQKSTGGPGTVIPEPVPPNQDSVLLHTVPGPGLDPGGPIPPGRFLPFHQLCFNPQAGVLQQRGGTAVAGEDTGPPPSPGTFQKPLDMLLVQLVWS